MDSEKFLLKGQMIKKEVLEGFVVLEDISSIKIETSEESEETINNLVGQILSFEDQTVFQDFVNEGCTKERDIHTISNTTKDVEIKTYACNDCGFKSKYKCSFNKHYRFNNRNCQKIKDSRYFCDLCDFRALRKLELSEHKVLIHNGKVIADVRSNGGEDLKGQIMDDQFVKPTSSEIVDKEEKPNDLLNSQGNALTKIKEEYDSDSCCEIHEATFRESRCHIRKKCQTCAFSTRYNLKMFCHYRKYRHKLFQCDECSMSSVTKAIVEKHKQIHHSNVIIWYNCDQCDFKSKSQRGVLRHKKLIHQSRKSFICSECASTFITLKSLKAHILFVHVNKDKRLFSCDLCSYKCKRKWHLTVHQKLVHWKTFQQKYVFCGYCVKKFQSQKFLDIHLVKIHKQKIDLPTYICYTCGYQNINKFAFTAHVTRHSKHEQLFCANCDYKTYNKSNLVQHMVKHMKHVKMHKCHLCSFETKRPHTLRAHVKTH